MKVELQPGFVLHSRPYRDTSALVEAYTAGHGRIGLVARGARAQKSRLRGALQPFRQLLLSWTGSGELHTLTGVEEVGPVLRLTGEQLISGFYVNELVMRLSHRSDANTQLFACYGATLQALAAGGNPHAVLRIFEKRLLEALGYGLQLQHDAQGRPIEAQARYRYQLEHGPVAVAAGAGPEGAADLELSGAALLALAAEQLQDEAALRESKALMRAVLTHYLGPKPLRSRELFQRPPKGPAQPAKH